MTIEVAMITVNGLMIASMLTKDDPRPRETRAFLTDQGMMQNHGPGWGVLERFSAASLHLGFTLLVFAQPWLVLATIGGALGYQHARRSLWEAVDRSHRARRSCHRRRRPRRRNRDLVVIGGLDLPPSLLGPHALGKRDEQRVEVREIQTGRLMPRLRSDSSRTLPREQPGALRLLAAGPL
jgi:hypothetical protein